MCTDASNFGVLVKPICDLKMIFHVDAHWKWTDSRVSCSMRAKILDPPEFHSFMRTHEKSSQTMKNLSMSCCTLGIHFMAVYAHSSFIKIPRQHGFWWILWIQFRLLSQRGFDSEMPQQMLLLLIKVWL
jgi:hypothetical protein